MKKLTLMFAALCGMLPVMAMDTAAPTFAGAVHSRVDAAADAVADAVATVGDMDAAAAVLEDSAEDAAEAARKRLGSASGRAQGWAGNIGNFFTNINKQRRDLGISNWDAGLGLGSLGALGTWLAYHGWKTRQARRQLALEKAKSKLASLLKKVQQAKTPEAREQALFEYRTAEREAIAAYQHKQSWSKQWTDRLRGAWQGDYGWQHQLASAVAPALFGGAMATHGIGHYRREQAKKRPPEPRSPVVTVEDDGGVASPFATPRAFTPHTPPSSPPGAVLPLVLPSSPSDRAAPFGPEFSADAAAGSPDVPAAADFPRPLAVPPPPPPARGLDSRVGPPPPVPANRVVVTRSATPRKGGRRRKGGSQSARRAGNGPKKYNLTGGGPRTPRL